MDEEQFALVEELMFMEKLKLVSMYISLIKELETSKYDFYLIRDHNKNLCDENTHLKSIADTCNLVGIDNLRIEMEINKMQLEEAIQLIEEMCVDDCGIDLAKEDRKSLGLVKMMWI